MMVGESGQQTGKHETDWSRFLTQEAETVNGKGVEATDSQSSPQWHTFSSKALIINKSSVTSLNSTANLRPSIHM